MAIVEKITLSGFNAFEHSLKRDEPLAHHTSFRIGGPARFFYKAKKPGEPIRAVEWAWKEDIPLIVLVGGSNVLVADEGFPGLVVVNACSGWEVCEEEGGLLVKVASGTPLGRLARWALREGWAGLEWAVTIPGTVGGAVKQCRGFRLCNVRCAERGMGAEAERASGVRARFGAGVGLPG